MHISVDETSSCLQALLKLWELNGMDTNLELYWLRESDRIPDLFTR